MDGETMTNKAEPFLGVLEWKPGPNGGVLIERLDKYGTLGKAKFSVGDELISIDGAPFDSHETVTSVLQQAGVGGTVKVQRIRGRETEELEVKVRAKRTLNLDLDDSDELLERKISP
jgi:S1-C subfamily serine protease